MPGGVISQIHQAPAVPIPPAPSIDEGSSSDIRPPEDPLAELLKSGLPSRRDTSVSRPSEGSDEPRHLIYEPNSPEATDTDGDPTEDLFDEILKRGAHIAGEDLVDNSLESLLHAGPKLDSDNDVLDEPSFKFPPLPFDEGETKKPQKSGTPSLEEIMGIRSLSDLEKPLVSPDKREKDATSLGNTIPDLPDDKKTEPDNPPQDDFLRMFPGARG
jgi:hypothetical protein